MNQLLKTLLMIVAGIVGVIVFASVALVLFFDPNDYRDEISASVKEVTGRDLTIEGDLSLSIFPWLAIEVGRTELGNAEGFGDKPFMRFEAASLSVRMLPLILSQETTVGTASIAASFCAGQPPGRRAIRSAARTAVETVNTTVRASIRPFGVSRTTWWPERSIAETGQSRDTGTSPAVRRMSAP